MKIITKYFILGYLLIFIGSSCKESTRPQPADCDVGHLPCEEDIEDCCEVTCPETFHNCGDFLTECCLDTTSHDFNWEIFTLGDYGSTVRDMTIIDKNNIWAVGNFEIGDEEFNAAKWDGEEWEFLGFYSNTLDFQSINYFSENDIWITSFCLPYHWDGNLWTQYHIQNMGLDACVGNDIWGISSSDIYFIGVEGDIVYYNGSNFIKIASGTNINLRDIDGTPDGEYVFIVGRNDSGESIALMIHDNQVSTLYEGDGIFSEPHGYLKGVSVLNDTAYYASHNTLWKYNYLTEESDVIQREDIFETLGATRRIDARQINDISIMTIVGEIVHYNGETWLVDNTIIDYYGLGNIYTKSISFKNNTIVTAGYSGNFRAVVCIGTRQ